MRVLGGRWWREARAAPPHPPRSQGSLHAGRHLACQIEKMDNTLVQTRSVVKLNTFPRGPGRVETGSVETDTWRNLGQLLQNMQKKCLVFSILFEIVGQLSPSVYLHRILSPLLRLLGHDLRAISRRGGSPRLKHLRIAKIF